MSDGFALVSPLPPQKTGIADYAAGLVRGLREAGLDIRLYTQSRFAGDDEFAATPLAHFDEKREAPERTIYQIGNNRTFHDEQILQFLRLGGIAHIHDFSLHHIFAHFTYIGDQRIYFALLEKWYGFQFADQIRQGLSTHCTPLWETPDVLTYPLHEEVVDRAKGVIVHSNFAKRFIQNRFPTKAVVVVPQRYPDGVPARRSKERPFRIASLGFVDPYKIVDRKIEAISICRDRGVEIELDVVGELSQKCERLPELAIKLGVQDLVHFHGRVSQDKLIDQFRTTDACIVLRYPTVGETSAIVSRALQYGVPMIVNDVGSYSELPEFVPKVPIGANLSTRLADVLCHWVRSPGAYSAVLKHAFQYANGAANFSNSIKRYKDVLLAYAR